MQQPANQQPNYSEFQTALADIKRQLERQDERLREGATKTDLAELRKELVRQDALAPQLIDLQRQIVRVEADRLADKIAMENDIKEIKQERISRTERLWQRIGPIIGILALLITFLEFYSHVKWLP